jgi:U3 small nucleolar RNA-associated protein 5
LNENDHKVKKQRLLENAAEAEKTQIPALGNCSGLIRANDVVDATFADLGMDGDREEVDTDGSDLTLAERVEALRERVEVELAGELIRRNAEEDTLELGGNERPDASSLSTLLQQALQSKDNAMLEYCLRARDVKVIANTIKRVSSVKILELLEILVLKFEKSPGRCARLCPWMRSILLHHTAYLMTQPDLVQSLSALYQILENRLKVHDALQKLSGRLSLVIGQIHESSASVNDVPSAKIVYRAGTNALVNH